MAAHSSILDWEIPWKMESDGLQSIGSQTDRTERLNTHARQTRQSFWQKEQCLFLTPRGDRRWHGWMASPTWWTWVWVNSVSWWWTGKPGVLQPVGSQRVRHNWATELNWYALTEALVDTPFENRRICITTLYTSVMHLNSVFLYTCVMPSLNGNQHSI